MGQLLARLCIYCFKTDTARHRSRNRAMESVAFRWWKRIRRNHSEGGVHFYESRHQCKRNKTDHACTVDQIHLSFPIATMTTLLNAPIGAVLNEEQQKNNLFRLIQEIASIANAQGIGLPVTIVADTLNKIESLPFETYSSMHFDHYRGKKTEIDSLTGQVCKLGKSMGIPTPAHDEALALIKGSS